LHATIILASKYGTINKGTSKGLLPRLSLAKHHLGWLYPATGGVAAFAVQGHFNQ